MRATTALALTLSVGVLVAAASPARAAPYTFTPFDVPGATQTTPFGINDAGQIVGFLLDGTGVHGFVGSGGSFAPIDVPGGMNTQARGINDAGQVVGFFDHGQEDQHGFLLDGGSFTPVDVPGACGTGPDGINDAAQIVGG